MSVISKFLGNILSPDNWAVHSYLQLADSAGNGSEIHQARVTLTATQVKALHTTPITLIAAPGTGKYLDLLSIVGILKFNSAAYTGANNMKVSYTDNSGAEVTSSGAFPADTTFLDATADAVLKDVGAYVAPVANAPIVVSVGTANPGAGDSPITFEMLYRVVTLP